MRVLIFLALLGAAFAVPKNMQRIVGGSPTTIENYPYMSNMQYTWLGVLWYHTCGGTLINSRSVLTAAHCILGDTPSQYRVRLGTSFASSGGTVHDVSQFILHADYSPFRPDHDIAIMHLSTAATFGATIAAASIAGANYNLADGTLVTTMGWGVLTPGGDRPEQLQHVDIYTINHTYCEERYAYLKTLPGFEHWPEVTDNMLCSGIQYEGGKDACQNDSGGPLVHNGDVLVGIVSWGYSCAHAEYPGVYTRVSRYVDWIAANA